MLWVRKSNKKEGFQKDEFQPPVMIQKMFLKAETQTLESALPRRGLTRKRMFLDDLLIAVFASGILMEVCAHSSVRTIAVLERGRDPNYPTVCAIESGGDQTLSCWDSPDSSVFRPQAGRWIGVVAGGTFMCGLQCPGRNAVCWAFGANIQFAVPRELKSVAYKDIAAGQDHICGIRVHEGRLDCWNRSGNMDNLPLLNQTMKLVTAANGWTCTAAVAIPPELQESLTCWSTQGRVLRALYVKDAAHVSYNSISAGDKHLCVVYDGFGPTSGQHMLNRVFCWTLVENAKDILPCPDSSVDGLVTGPDYACSLGIDTGYMECWGPGRPQLNALQPVDGNSSNIQFSRDGVAASGRIICGVGLNDRFAFRSVCFRADNKTTPQPFLFFLPSRCGKTCSDGGSVQHYFPSSSPWFEEQYQSVRQSFCSEPGESLCIPCYTRLNGEGCNGSTSSSPYETSKEPRLVERAKVVGGVLTALFAVVALILAFVAFIVWSKSSGKDRGCRGLCTKLTSVEHFCQHQVMFNMNLIEFSYKDLEVATNAFHNTNFLGQGSSGCVFKGKLLDKRQVAVKKLMNNGMVNQSDLTARFDGELKLLARLRHENLVNLVGYCHQRTARNVCWCCPRRKPSARIDYRLLVFEYMPNGTLHSHLHRRENHLDRPVLDWDMRLRIVLQAARGINYLHYGSEPPIIHRDIKSSNILLDVKWNARLSDLGISRLGPLGNRTHVSTSPAGTLGYLDPEYYRSQHLTFKSDVYSFGVVLLEVLTGFKAIEAQSDPANIVERCVPIIQSGAAQSILDQKIPPHSSIDKLLLVANIAESCVRMVQHERPSIAEVLCRLEGAAAAPSSAYTS